MTQYAILLVHGSDDTQRRFQQMPAALLGRVKWISCPPDASIPLEQCVIEAVVQTVSRPD